MQAENAKIAESVHAALTRAGGQSEEVQIKGRYVVECIGPDGEVKWRDTIDNLVTTVGKNGVLDKILDLGAAYSGIHMMLKGAGAAANGDTMASHAAWSEVTDYTGNRPVPAFSAASAGSKATSAAVSFAISGTATVAGVAVVLGGSATKGNTTGTLFSAGDFSGGSRAVQNGDTLNVSYTASLT